MEQQQFPTEEVTLPSKGLLYPEESPLRSGKISLKYMTAREEDILTNVNLIKNGTVLDKLLKSLIVTPNVNYDDLLVGDKNAILIAARVLGYGPEYDIQLKHPETGIESKATIDLTTIDESLAGEPTTVPAIGVDGPMPTLFANLPSPKEPVELTEPLMFPLAFILPVTSRTSVADNTPPRPT